TQQSSTSQTSPSTTAPAATTATPTATTATPSSGSSSTQQNEVNKYFNTLKSSNSSDGDGYQAGKVTAADESGSGVSILQSSEAGVEKTPSTQQTDDADQTADSDTKQVTTKTKAKSSGTSPVFIAMAVLAAVGGIALAAVAYSVKKKKLDDKRIDRDENLARSFDTFSSPLRINETIAQI
ncbi:hypothetical protein L917_20243, partial [Phytophthora nicotianae]